MAVALPSVISVINRDVGRKSLLLSRVSTAMMTRRIDIAMLSVRHAPVLYRNGLTYFTIFFSIL